MPDQRELYEDPEEAIRSAWAGIRTHMHVAMPAILEQDSPDGHTARLVLAVKRAVEDRIQDQVSYEEFPVLADVPIHHPGAGGITHTFAVKAKDEAVALFSSRSIDAWHQSGGTQQPIFNRLHSLSDAMVIPGLRSDPRKLEQVSAESAQIRSDDKHHTADTHPQNGFTHKSVDPTTPPASATFDPFKAAAKFFAHLVHPTNGIAGNATDGDTTHSHGVDHDTGAWMKAVNGLHSVLADPQNGASLNALGQLHQVLAHPSLGSLLSAAAGAHVVHAHPDNGVQVKSATAISIASSGPLSLSAPPGMLSLPSKSVGNASLGDGAAASNVGTLGGDLSGTLPDPQVVGIGNVKGANLLPNCATDVLAAAAGVAIGSLYRNGSALMVRVA